MYCQFLQNFVDGKPRQAVQLQFEDGVDLDIAEAESVATAGGFDFRSASGTIFPAIELHAFEFRDLPFCRDGDILLAENWSKFSLALARLEEPRMMRITLSR